MTIKSKAAKNKKWRSIKRDENPPARKSDACCGEESNLWSHLCGGPVVSVLAFYPDDLSSNPAGYYIFCAKRQNMNEKEASVVPPLKSHLWNGKVSVEYLVGQVKPDSENLKYLSFGFRIGRRLGTLGAAGMASEFDASWTR